MKVAHLTNVQTRTILVHENADIHPASAKQIINQNKDWESLLVQH